MVWYRGWRWAPGTGLETEERWKEELLLQNFPVTTFPSKPNGEHGQYEWDLGAWGHTGTCGLVPISGGLVLGTKTSHPDPELE